MKKDHGIYATIGFAFGLLAGICLLALYDDSNGDRSVHSSCRGLVRVWRLDGSSAWAGTDCAPGDSLTLWLGQGKIAGEPEVGKYEPVPVVPGVPRP